MDICRACMLLESNLIPLDELFISNYNLLTNLNVKLDDNLPQYCCNNCAEIVKHFIEFRNKSITSEITFKELKMVQSIKVEYDATKICDEQDELEIKTEMTDTFDSCGFELNEAFEYNNHAVQEINVTKKSSKIRTGNIKIETLDTGQYNKSTKLKKVRKSQKRKKPKKKSSQDKEASKRKKYLCGICIKNFQALDDLRSHIETHKMDKQCGICDEDTITWPQLLGHRLKHLAVTQQRCHICNKKHSTPPYMEYHYLLAHNEDGLEKSLICNKCGRTYQTPRNLMKHVWSSHSEARYFCDYCSKGFHSKCFLRKHIIKHLDYSSLTCQLCEFTCRSYGALQRHKISKHCPLKVQCKKCYRYFVNQEKCDKHKCFDNSFVVCPVCGLQFQRSYRFSKHLRSHKQDYKCSLCPSVYKTSAALKTHMDRHNGNRTRECEYCTAKFYSYSSLIKHRRRHTGEKPYVCKICEKGFTGNNNLKMHMRVHGLFLIVKKKKEETNIVP